MQELDHAIILSSDIPDVAPPKLGDPVRTGRPGRPRKYVDPQILENISVGRTMRTEIAEMHKSSARLIRRRLVEFGLSEPGPPVYTEHTDVNGDTIREYRRGQCSDLSTITDEELDELVLNARTQFPSFGRQMLDGYLMGMGHRVPRSRVVASLQRVTGESGSAPNRRLYRREYWVPGPNSLWHHDGQHGWFTSPKINLYSLSCRACTLENFYPWIHRRVFTTCTWSSC